MSLVVALANSVRQHCRIAGSYPAAVIILLAIAIQIVYAGWLEHTAMHAVGYLLAVWCGCLVTDIVVNMSPMPAVGFPIRHSSTQEVLVILGSVMLGAIFLIVRFSRLWTTIHGIGRLSLSALIPFVFPIALALVFLFAYRYRPSELGVNAHYWYLPFFINLLVGGITLAVAPQLSHWRSFFREAGFFGGLYTGLITAGLSEEFTRMLLQTRLGYAFHNKGLGFVAATFIWASAHIPVDWSQNPTASFLQIVVGSSHIIPIGILWGYMTHRSKSLLPAVLTHGLNLWGLQNSL